MPIRKTKIIIVSEYYESILTEKTNGHLCLIAKDEEKHPKIIDIKLHITPINNKELYSAMIIYETTE